MVDIDEKLKKKTFNELVRLIRACISGVNDLSDEDKELATNDKAESLKYIEILEAKIPLKPNLPEEPKLEKINLTSLDGYEYVSAKTENDLRYKKYLDEKATYEKNISRIRPILERIEQERRIVSNLREKLEPNLFVDASLNWRSLAELSNVEEWLIQHFERLSRVQEDEEWQVYRINAVLHYLKKETFEVYTGKGEFANYVAFHLPHLSLTIMECPIHGNATYIFYENWEQLSKLSKSTLRSYPKEKVIKVIHQPLSWGFEIDRIIRNTGRRSIFYKS